MTGVTRYLENDKKVNVDTYQSPVGVLLLGATAEHLLLCDWCDVDGKPRDVVMKRLSRYLEAEFVEGRNEVIDIARRQLDEYFAGTRKDFDLPVMMFGTPFQRRTWDMLCRIPYGETWSYSRQAEAMGCAKAVRAVANANRLNALSVIVPCHRVVGSNNKLTGYAGGLEAKRWLIEWEKGFNSQK